MMPPALAAASGFLVRYGKLAVAGAMMLGIIMLKLSLASEQRHSAKLQQQLSETAAAYDRFRADVAAKTALAKVQDEARARRVERDQTLVSQETVNAYQREISVLRARAAQRLRRGPSATDPSGGGNAGMSGLPHAASRVDGAASQDGLSDQDALMASEIALRLKALQEWVHGQKWVER